MISLRQFCRKRFQKLRSAEGTAQAVASLHGQPIHQVLAGILPQEHHIRVFMFRSIRTDGLSQLFLAAQGIEHIVPDLKCHADGSAGEEYYLPLAD